MFGKFQTQTSAVENADWWIIDDPEWKAAEKLLAMHFRSLPLFSPLSLSRVFSPAANIVLFNRNTRNSQSCKLVGIPLLSSF